MDEEYNEHDYDEGPYMGEDYNLWEEEQVFQDHEGRDYDEQVEYDEPGFLEADEP